MPVRGRPLLGWWFDLFRRHGVTETLVNTHYRAPLVENFAAQYGKACPELRIRTVYEPELLGSGGTVWVNRDFVREEESFFICYADNLTDVDLTAMERFHAGHGAPLTMALFHAPDPSQCGIAGMDGAGRIIRFTEKPERPESGLANAGLYLARREFFDAFPRRLPLDIGFDVLPRLVGEMYGWPVKGYLLDIGVPENFYRAQEEWPHDYL